MRLTTCKDIIMTILHCARLLKNVWVSTNLSLFRRRDVIPPFLWTAFGLIRLSAYILSVFNLSQEHVIAELVAPAHATLN